MLHTGINGDRRSQRVSPSVPLKVARRWTLMVLIGSFSGELIGFHQPMYYCNSCVREGVWGEGVVDHLPGKHIVGLKMGTGMPRDQQSDPLLRPQRRGRGTIAGSK